MDTVLVDRLIEILDKETAIYESILKLSKNKTDVIAEGKVSELENVTKVEQTMILQLGKLEEEREELVEKLAVQLQLKPSDITVSNLEKLLPKGKSDKLVKCRQELSGIVKELGEANMRNSKLIRSSLDYIDFSINMLTGAGSTGNNYVNSGQTSEAKKRNLFDMKL